MDAEEIQIDQSIFGFLLRKAPADDVWYCIDLVFVLYGCTYAHCSWAFSGGHPFEQAIASVLKDEFLPMGSDIDKSRIEFHKTVDGLIELFNALSLHGGKYFKAEERFPLCFPDVVGHFHVNRSNSERATFGLLPVVDSFVLRNPAIGLP